MPGLAGCSEPPAPTAAAPAARGVDIVQVEPGDLPVSFEFVGRTASSQRVEIRARVAGYLDEIVYTEGDPVAEGDVLFRIDPAPFEARLRAANAELAQQQARLANARTLLARIRPLAEADAVALKELDDAEGRVNEAAAAVEGASARVFEAELNLGYTTITAPVGGLTGASDQREGAYIGGLSAPLTYVARIDPIWVEFSVSETQILRAARSRADGVVAYPADGNFDVAIVLADGSEHGETGRVTFADATISERTGTFLIRAEIPNPNRTIRPGQYVRVVLRGARRPGAISVPKRAVNEGPRGAYVWVVDRGGMAEQRPVVTGPWVGDSWVIEQGLNDGDRVVVDGGMGLQPGIPLSILSIVRDDVAVEGRRSASAGSAPGTGIDTDPASTEADAAG
jgi:membrane fusion protein (multidrug efflux system)